MGEQMKLYIDSADIKTVTELLRLEVFAGVTTNPSILHRSGFSTKDRQDVVQSLLDAGAEEVFAQTVTHTRDEIVAEGQEIFEASDRVIVKVPATPEGFAATQRLGEMKIPVLITAVYHPKQALLAGAVDAWGIAPYVGRMSDLGKDGVVEVRRMREILNDSGTRILAASLREVDLVCELAEIGIHSATVSTTVAYELLNDENVTQAVADFDSVA